MEDELEIGEINALFGAYYKDNGQGVKDIQKKLKTPTPTEELFTRLNTTATYIDKSHHRFKEVLQANQNVFVHKGGQEFKPERIELENLMIDYAQTPKELQGSWLDFLSNQDIDPKTAPLVKFTIDCLIDQAQMDYENNFYHAKKGVITPGQATPTIQSFDGLKQKFIKYKNEQKMKIIALGALPNPASLGAAKETCQYFEEFIKGVPPEYRPYIDFLITNESTALLYQQGVVETYNAYYQQVKMSQDSLGDEVEMPIMFSKSKVKGVRSHLNTDAVWMTSRGNAAIGVKNGKNEGNFISSVKDNKQVQISSNWWKGFGFLNPYELWHNGQDLTNN